MRYESVSLNTHRVKPESIEIRIRIRNKGSYDMMLVKKNKSVSIDNIKCDVEQVYP